MSLRTIIIKRIQSYGYLDYCWTRGDRNADKYGSYRDWLNSLDDEELLDAFVRIEEASNNLD